MTIHGVDKAVTDDVLDGGGQRIEKRRQLALLGFAKRSEYVTNHPLAFGFTTNVRTTDAATNSQIVWTEQPRDRSQAVVSAMSTSLLHFQPPKIEVDVVMNDDDLRRL